MNEIGEKYLPLGTVVLLKGGTKEVMITGFVGVTEEAGNKIFDYSGCVYPEGFTSYKQILVFDHNQIDKVLFKGYVSDAEIKFKEELNRKMNEHDNVNM